jgi:hypothetical protein
MSTAVGTSSGSERMRTTSAVSMATSVLAPMAMPVPGLQACGRLHREAEEILRAVDGAREVARELLARIVESLSQILMQVGNVNRAMDGEALAGAVTGVFNDHQMFTESVTDFYAYLAGVLTVTTWPARSTPSSRVCYWTMWT